MLFYFELFFDTIAFECKSCTTSIALNYYFFISIALNYFSMHLQVLYHIDRVQVCMIREQNEQVQNLTVWMGRLLFEGQAMCR